MYYTRSIYTIIHTTAHANTEEVSWHVMKNNACLLACCIQCHSLKVQVVHEHFLVALGSSAAAGEHASTANMQQLANGAMC